MAAPAPFALRPGSGTVRALVPLPDDVRGGDVLTVVGNFGTSLSSERPLHKARVRARPGSAARLDGWLLDSWLQDDWLDESPGGGFLDGPWLEEAWLDPRPLRAVDLNDVHGYGRFSLAVVPVNFADQDKGAAPAIATVFVADPPLPIGGHGFAEIDAVNNAAVFAVTHNSMEAT